MEEIAREAGYSVGSLYTYFKGKEELYASLLRAIADELWAASERPLPASLTFRQRLEMQFLQQLEIIERNREFLVVLAPRAPAQPDLGDELSELTHKIYQDGVERMAEWARQGLEQGVLGPAEPRDIAYLIVDAFYGAVLRWAAGDLPGSLTEHTPVLLDLIFNGIGVGDGANS